MKKYNKNLYYYASLKADEGAWYNNLKLAKGISIAFWISCVYMFIISGMTLIGSVMAYTYSNVQDKEPIKALAIWMGIVVASCVASVVFFCIKRQYAALIFGLVAAIGNIASTADLYSGKHLVFRYILPSILVFCSVVIFTVVITLKKRNVHEEYTKISDRIYKAAAAANGEIGVNSRILEKMMNEYDGKEIKMPKKMK